MQCQHNERISVRHPIHIFSTALPPYPQDRFEIVMGIMDQNIFGHNFTSPRWVAEPDYRGTFSILSTCIVTLVLCVWTAIHLNVPGHQEGAVRLYVRKCGWMLLGLLIPELVS